ncbi:hypothetical protein J5U23_02170 [Saccharolobus shibatae B12]|uniref:Uncharacterized protein n=1 Tax=Saccharolobus shibatae (strain ATCC 51178 / DSM 5389 / JCM 8931 / NBRC 15437 / B12) TaxID=523848 RepID=A0A8F5BPY2_SACSH|nr:hypothetical protein [Saccharolobus shibatae]QXJ29301.1 hypothetical protein J5U23_02170 [Saccharolobus shibatae B12]
MINIVLRILWSGGVTRVALEEARNMNAKLGVYRNAGTKYDLSKVNLQVLFEKNNSKSIYKSLTSIYAKK